MKFVAQIKKKIILFASFAVLVSSSAGAHNGDWFQSNAPGGNNFDFFIPILFPWAYVNPVLRPTARNAQQFAPLHVTLNNNDNTQTHVTFGTDSREGNNSQFPRYAYYPNWRSDNAQWRILGNVFGPTYRSSFLTYPAFQARVRSDIQTYQSLLADSPSDWEYYSQLINDARAAIGDPSVYGPGGSSILASWWRDYSQQAPTSTSGTPPSPTPTHDEL